jgi:hypothetical protein
VADINSRQYALRRGIILISTFGKKLLLLLGVGNFECPDCRFDRTLCIRRAHYPDKNHVRAMHAEYAPTVQDLWFALASHWA